MKATRGARSVRELTDELTERQLRSVPLFADCSSADLAWIAARSSEARLATGAVVVVGGTVTADVPIDGNALTMDTTRPGGIPELDASGWPSLVTNLRVVDATGGAVEVSVASAAGCTAPT